MSFQVTLFLIPEFKEFISTQRGSEQKPATFYIRQSCLVRLRDFPAQYLRSLHSKERGNKQYLPNTGCS